MDWINKNKLSWVTQRDSMLTDIAPLTPHGRTVGTEKNPRKQNMLACTKMKPKPKPISSTEKRENIKLDSWARQTESGSSLRHGWHALLSVLAVARSVAECVRDSGSRRFRLLPAASAPPPHRTRTHSACRHHRPISRRCAEQVRAKCAEWHTHTHTKHTNHVSLWPVKQILRTRTLGVKINYVQVRQIEFVS